MAKRAPAQSEAGELPGFAPGEVRVGFSSSTVEARTGLKMEGRSPDGGWCCRAFLGKDAGNHLVITRLEVWPWSTDIVAGGTPHVGLSTDVVRSLPLGTWLTQAHSLITDEANWERTGVGDYHKRLKGFGFGPVDEDRRAWAHRQADAARSLTLQRGRRGYSDDHYRRIALEYLELQSQGGSRGIVKRLAEQQDPSREWQTVRDWLHRATELGYLSPGRKGRSGRLPGPNLYREESK